MKFRERESRMVAVRGWGRKEWGVVWHRVTRWKEVMDDEVMGGGHSSIITT